MTGQPFEDQARERVVQLRRETEGRALLPAQTRCGQDLNFLAYGLALGGRAADAAPALTSIGKYMTMPWSWWDHERGDVSFVRARRRAHRVA